MKPLNIMLLMACLVAGCSTTHDPVPGAVPIAGTRAVISFDANNQVYINGQIVEQTAIGTALAASGLPRETPVVIRANRTMPHQIVANALVQVREAGFVNVTLAINEDQR